MSSRGLPQFELLTPQTIGEALDMLAQHQSRVSVLSGGTALWNHARKLKRITPYVLSMSALQGLDYLKYSPGEGLRIGARTTVNQLLASPEVAARYPALHAAGYWFGNTQIRNVATIMGNILRASPSADFSCALLALGGQVVLQGKGGQRTVDFDDFWLAYDVTARKLDELAVEIRLPEPTAGTRTGFERVTRVRQDLAKLNLAVRLEMEGGICRGARIAVGSVGPTVVRLKQTESMLEGVAVDGPLLERLAEAARGEISPIDDQRSTAEYRRQVAGVLVKRLVASTAAATAG